MRGWLNAVVIAAGSLGAACPLLAAEASPPTGEGTASCVEVEVNGMRAPSFPCLTQKLSPKPAPGQPPSERKLASEAIVARPSNALGLFNYSATSHRMGNTFGTSVTPQRP
ncbi:hypothetical protein [Cupriavidus basilensis]|uniref:hypothetical protein n=1 Tax=Cupriavidus basilensis TaxID=68895 RepID=UPI00157BA114|nr:hypothetical protein [Cupriavidus basilensis]NUA31628.1 hypothetical protein [Cupriavidus basilensis]